MSVVLALVPSSSRFGGRGTAEVSAMPTLREYAGRFDLKRSGPSFRGTCPACSYPEAFSLRQGRNGHLLAYCFSCTDLPAISQAIGQQRNGWFLIADRPAAKEMRHKRTLDAALRIWNDSVSAVGTLAERYLARRGLADLSGSSALRFHAACHHPHGSRFPALIALAVDFHGNPLGIHRTYLSPDGWKAAIDPVRASLGNLRGGAVRLDPCKPDRPLVIGEGIETSASAGRIKGLAAWSAISAGNLKDGVVLPVDQKIVMIAADPDNVGRGAAEHARSRFQAEGRQVHVLYPDGAGDFNNIWMERNARETYDVA